MIPPTTPTTGYIDRSAPFVLGLPLWKPTIPPFKDREDAGIALGQALINQYGEELRGALLLGCARGGIVVAKAAFEQMASLSPTLDVIIVRKIGCPDDPEYGAGAITQTGRILFNQRALIANNIEANSPALQAVILKEQQELARRVSLYRQGQKTIEAAGKVVVIIDDGISGGMTMRACIESLRDCTTPKRIIIAVPVASPTVLPLFREESRLDEKDICCLTFAGFPKGQSYWSIDPFYGSFLEVTNEDVQRIMSR